jgi:hypothetical protein
MLEFFGSGNERRRALCGWEMGRIKEGRSMSDARNMRLYLIPLFRHVYSMYYITRYKFPTAFQSFDTSWSAGSVDGSVDGWMDFVKVKASFLHFEKSAG